MRLGKANITTARIGERETENKPTLRIIVTVNFPINEYIGPGCGGRKLDYYKQEFSRHSKAY
jgi:hypothetical protein